MNLNVLLPAIRKAGAVAMEIYRSDFSVDMKDDQSPVTRADLAVDDVLGAALTAHFPEIPFVTEERSANHSHDISDDLFFLVDPIDGTKEFIKKTGEFTINIALVKNRVPIGGIVYAPALGRLFLADIDESACEIDAQNQATPVAVRDCGSSDLVAVASKSHNTPETQAFLDENKINDCVSAGSSLKFCVLAAGEADIYPRFGPTMEWDTAAGDAVLRAAGGTVLNTDGSQFEYGKPDFRNPNFIACSPQAAKRCQL